MDLDTELPESGVPGMGDAGDRCFCHKTQLEVQVVLRKRDLGPCFTGGRPPSALEGQVFVPVSIHSTDFQDGPETPSGVPQGHPDYAVVAQTTLVCNIAGPDRWSASLPDCSGPSLSGGGEILHHSIPRLKLTAWFLKAA